MAIVEIPVIVPQSEAERVHLDQLHDEGRLAWSGDDSVDQREDGIPSEEEEPRSAAINRDDRPIHRAATANEARISVAVRLAFALGRRALRPLLSEMRAANCGTGAGGFQEGNTCATGGSWTNTSPKTAAEISGVKPAEPLKTYKAYHVTKRENADSIIKNGFDLEKVKPRWMNDHAVSLSKGEKAAVGS